MPFRFAPALFLGLTWGLLAASAHAQISPVRVRVEQVSKSDTSSYKTVQTRSQNVIVTSTAKEPLELQVKYAVFGRDLKSKEIVNVAQGELPLSLKPQGVEKLTTPEAFAMSEESRIGSKGKNEDAGNRIIGQGVQVWKGETMLAEAYEPASLKASFGKAPPAKVIEKKK